jgi:hypothetical protein
MEGDRRRWKLHTKCRGCRGDAEDVEDVKVMEGGDELI